ncbi:pyruvate decarboxylase-like [Oryza sativa Japonica Group]|uniref:Pyruvate decarboxylase-like n=1 Tax=Oryza sativa subsp. japonica TaxID=39947 RepID=Q657A0_ORYSJ|nr:pyruvate decarboxylase-like [Oryza sativa Japonica Group]
METTGGGGSPKEAVVPSAASGDTTLGRHLAHRLVQDCSSTLASYAADGYARARGVGACAVTFTVRGQLLHGCRHRSHRFWNQRVSIVAAVAIIGDDSLLGPARLKRVGVSSRPRFPGATAALLPRRACRAHCIGNALPFSRVVVAEQRLACSVGQEEKSERETRKGEDGEERGG